MVVKAFVESIRSNIVYCISSGSACSSCKNKLLCKKSEKPFEVRNPNNINVKVGDMVELELNEKETVKALLITLLFPLTTLITSLIILSYFIISPLFLFLGSVFIMGLSLIIVYFINKKNKSRNTPILINNTFVNFVN